MITKIARECLLKQHLDDEELEQIESLVIEAIDTLKNIISEEIDVSLPYEKSLVKNYVRYAYNHADEEFQTNFSREIGGLQIKYSGDNDEEKH